MACRRGAWAKARDKQTGVGAARDRSLPVKLQLQYKTIPYSGIERIKYLTAPLGWE